MNIVEFLLARIAEDEAVAREAAGDASRWASTEPNGRGLHLATSADSMGWDFRGGSGVWECDDPYDDCALYRDRAFAESEHITRHDPVRVLAECEAKRRIVDLREQAARAAADPPQGAEMLTVARVAALNEALRILAQPYAQHPSFDPRWAV